MELIPAPTDIRAVIRDVVNQFRVMVPVSTVSHPLFTAVPPMILNGYLISRAGGRNAMLFPLLDVAPALVLTGWSATCVCSS